MLADSGLYAVMPEEGLDSRGPPRSSRHSPSFLFTVPLYCSLISSIHHYLAVRLSNSPVRFRSSKPLKQAILRRGHSLRSLMKHETSGLLSVSYILPTAFRAIITRIIGLLLRRFCSRSRSRPRPRPRPRPRSVQRPAFTSNLECSRKFARESRPRST
jgi:hypothetical protein